MRYSSCVYTCVVVVQVLIGKDIPEYDISNLFQKCGIPAKTLLSLPCRVFLNGNIQENNPSVLLQRMHRIFTVITRLSGKGVGSTLGNDIHAQDRKPSTSGDTVFYSQLKFYIV